MNFMPVLSVSKLEEQLKRLNLNIETRNAQNGRFREELELNGGKVQVPCLRIDSAGEVSWFMNPMILLTI